MEANNFLRSMIFRLAIRYRLCGQYGFAQFVLNYVPNHRGSAGGRTLEAPEVWRCDKPLGWQEYFHESCCDA